MEACWISISTKALPTALLSTNSRKISGFLFVGNSGQWCEFFSLPSRLFILFDLVFRIISPEKDLLTLFSTWLVRKSDKMLLCFEKLAYLSTRWFYANICNSNKINFNLFEQKFRESIRKTTGLNAFVVKKTIWGFSADPQFLTR